MHKVTINIVASCILLLVVAGCSTVFRGAFLIDNIETDINEETNFRFLYQGPDSTYWALFGAIDYGYYDYWVAHSKDKKQWEIYFTGERIYEDYKTRFDVTATYIEIEALSPRKHKAVIPIEYLKRDTDKDGLTDIAETRLCTDPENPDTDGDGILDFEDKNPLAARKIPKGDEEEIIKMVIEQSLSKDSRRAIIVSVKDENSKMEFNGNGGIIICLTKEETENFRLAFGFGEITSVSAKPVIEGNTAKVELVFYRGMLDAMGFEVNCEKDSDGSWKILSTRMIWIS